MQSIETFVADCLTAVRTAAAARAVHEVMKAAFADTSSVLRAVGTPTEGSLRALHRSDELTILNVVWKPGMSAPPHNHQTWAVIGIYCGREDNVFWRRVKDGPNGRIEVAGEKAFSAGDVMPLGSDIIHSVTNPLPQLTGAIHIYGGDFFTLPRSEWDLASLTERPYDVARTQALFGK